MGSFDKIIAQLQGATEDLKADNDTAEFKAEQRRIFQAALAHVQSDFKAAAKRHGEMVKLGLGGSRCHYL